MTQKGNSALSMVLIVLLMGSLTLHASRARLEQGLTLVADERRYFQAWLAAQSALSWGLTLSWPAAHAAGCQQARPQGWQSCLRRIDDARGLLKGQAIDSELALWRWVAWEGDRVRPLPHGWIDYCPLATPDRCL